MSGKLILIITMTVTSEGAPGAKYYVDPDEVVAEDTIRVECPRDIDAKALDVSKVIQGTLPGIIEEHNANWNRKYERVKEAAKPSLFTLTRAGDSGEENHV